MIHPTAIISPKAELGRNVRVGPYCVIGANVTLGDDCVLHSHVVLEGSSSFGKANEFFPFALVGGKSQDLKYIGEPTALEVGDHNVFRENTTIHRGTHEELPTRIGSHNLFLCYSHVAHDCQLGDHIILSTTAASPATSPSATTQSSPASPRLTSSAESANTPSSADFRKSFRTSRPS